MNKMILSAALVIFASVAQANFNGRFVGTGKVSTNKGMATNCESAVVVIKQSATVMDIDAKFTCGTKAVQGPAGVLTLKGNEVFNSAGAKIGTFSDTTVDLAFETADIFMTSNERMNGNTMTFKTVHGDKKTGIATTYEGTATR